MKIFTVVLDRPNETLWANLKSNWPEAHYIHDDRVAFVVDEDTRLTAEIAKSIGIADGKSGLVIQMDYLSGHTTSSLVEWINKRS